jgi:two-component system sensor histidine kinase QseC
MSYSLRGTLIRSLLKVVTPLWLVACALLAFHAWHEVNELYEEQQTLFARQLYGTLSTLGARNEPQLPQVGDSDHQAVAAWNRGGQLLLVDSDGLELDARPGYTGFASLR